MSSEIYRTLFFVMSVVGLCPFVSGVRSVVLEGFDSEV